MAPVKVEFHKGEQRRYRALLHRPDGCDVAFDGGAYNRVGGPAGDLPHDIAHLIVEEELGLRSGVWGVLVAGGMFRHAVVVGGRRAPHAGRRGREIIAPAGVIPMKAQIHKSAVCDLAASDADLEPLALRSAVGERWWSDSVTRLSLDRARGRLRDAAEQWAELFPSEVLAAIWRLPPP